MRYATKTKAFTTLITCFAFLLLHAATAFGQEALGNGQSNTKDISLSSGTSDSATPTVAKSQPTLTEPAERTESARSVPKPQPSGSTDEWHFEIRPYVWLAGIKGSVRVENTTADVGKSSSDVLGMLDFAAAAQLEAIHGPWRLILDENYVNLGTKGTGPLGLVTVEVEPTLNIFEFGGSYTAVSVENKKATASEPLPPIFTAEVLGGFRWFHLGLQLEPSIGSPADGSRNLIGPFVGNRFKVSPNKAVTLIGKYTVGGSGAGSNFAWSAEGLVDLRLKKAFSLGGGYRVLDMKANQPSNRVGFDGQLRGLILTMTLYR